MKKALTIALILVLAVSLALTACTGTPAGSEASGEKKLNIGLVIGANFGDKSFNDSALVRENLRLAVSSDGGTRWVRIATLEDAPGGDFGYPSLLQGSEGMIHCVYTWNRRAIKHAYFNQAWIDERLAEPTP